MTRIAVGREPSVAVFTLSPTEAQLYREIPPNIDFIPHPIFSLPSAKKILFGAGAEIIEIPDFTLGWLTDEESSYPTKRRRDILSREEEKTLFLRYNYSRYRLSQLIQKQKRYFSFFRVRQMLLWHGRVLRLREDIAKANLRLVVSFAMRVRSEGVDFPDLVSEGNMALLRSIERFDVSRGFKFSTYACKAIIKSYGRLAGQTARYYQRFPVEFNPNLEKDNSNAWKEEVILNDDVGALNWVLSKNIAGLTEVERLVITERFGIASEGEGKSLRQVGEMIGITNERIRQIQNKALGKIRTALKNLKPAKKRKI